jgi:hypothetical protein
MIKNGSFQTVFLGSFRLKSAGREAEFFAMISVEFSSFANRFLPISELLRQRKDPTV